MFEYIIIRNMPPSTLPFAPPPSQKSCHSIRIRTWQQGWLVKGGYQVWKRQSWRSLKYHPPFFPNFRLNVRYLIQFWNKTWTFQQPIFPCFPCFKQFLVDEAFLFHLKKHTWQLFSTRSVPNSLSQRKKYGRNGSVFFSKLGDPRKVAMNSIHQKKEHVFSRISLKHNQTKQTLLCQWGPAVLFSFFFGESGVTFFWKKTICPAGRVNMKRPTNPETSALLGRDPSESPSTFTGWRAMPHRRVPKATTLGWFQRIFCLGFVTLRWLEWHISVFFWPQNWWCSMIEHETNIGFTHPR